MIDEYIVMVSVVCRVYLDFGNVNIQTIKDKLMSVNPAKMPSVD